MSSCQVLSPGVECSLNGICVNASCVCQVSGFISIGDFRFKEGLDCDVFIPAVIALWCLVIVFSALAMTSSTFQLIMELRSSNGLRKPLNQVHLGIALSCSFWLILGIIRVSDVEKTAIGVDVTTSYFSVAANSWFSGFALFLLYRFYAVHSSFLTDVEERRSKFRKQLFIVFLFFLPPQFIVLVGLYHPSQGDVVLQIRFILEAINNLWYAVLAPLSLSPLIKSLDGAIARGNAKKRFPKLRNNLRLVRRELIVEPIFGSFVKFLFAFWPYLRQKVVYEFPIQILIWMVTITSISILLLKQKNDEKVSSSSEENRSKVVETGGSNAAVAVVNSSIVNSSEQ